VAATSDELEPAARRPLTRSQAEKPVFEVVGGPGGISREGLRELWHFRDVMSAFAIRQVKVRYKQAAIGIGWAVIQPVVAAAVFALFFGRFAGLSSEGTPYVLFALAGMVAWTYFSTATSQALESLVLNQSLLRKVYFPREVLPFSALLGGLVDLLPGLAALIVAAAMYGVAPGLPWLATPLVILLLLVAAAAFSVPLSAINVYYRDVRYALPFLLQLGLFISPVVYSLETVPARWREAYAILNPVAASIDSVRQIFVHGSWPDFTILFASLGWALLALGLGYAFFKRLERGISDRV
jgi:lipopolysaccharide transport system permease protein